MSNVRSIQGRLAGGAVVSQSSSYLVGLPVNQTGVIFAGRNGLDFLELRFGAVRIPEVTLRIREAQRILDGLEIERIDLMGSIIVEDDSFSRNSKLKALLASIIQVGLYDRLLKTQRAPDVLVGPAVGDSALMVCAGQISFENFVVSSEALQTLRSRDAAPLAPVQDGLLPMGLAGGIGLPLPAIQAPLVMTTLASMNSTEYRAYVRSEDGGFVEVGQPVMDIKKLLAEVVEHQMVQRFINVGPAAVISAQDCEQIAESAGTDEVTVIDSIDLDPMLNWFWKQVRPASGFAQ